MFTEPTLEDNEFRVDRQDALHESISCLHRREVEPASAIDLKEDVRRLVRLNLL